MKDSMSQASTTAWALLAVTGTATAAVLVRQRLRKYNIRDDVIPPGNEDLHLASLQIQNESYFDVIIVGAGPAGSTASYYLGHANKGLKILLLERKQFPRVKYCGDAWCSQALDLLEDMQYQTPNGKTQPILQYLEDQHKCRPVQRGGFISPFGYECINTEGAQYGSVASVRTYSIKRVIVDEIMARAAQQQPGVELRELANVQVDQVEFDDTEQVWKVPYVQKQPDDKTIPNKQVMTVKGKVLVAADGATSYLARQLNLVTQDADVVCSHRYVVGNASSSPSSDDNNDNNDDQHHNFTADGVMFFNRSVLPGYSALFKHYNNDIYLGTYILPGGQATSRCIAGFEQELVNRHPYVRSAFGGDDKHPDENVYAKTQWRNDAAQGENGKMKIAPIRCGGEAKSFGDHLVVIGDAAGQVDPLTGEGIHTAMVAAKICADTILEMFSARNFSETATQSYHQRWMKAFGNDFPWSAMGAKLIYRFPILLDAACAYRQERGGQSFLDEFGLIMTGMKPKSDFLQFKLAVPITLYLLREIVVQHILRRPPLIPQDIGQALVEKYHQSAQQKNTRLNPQ